MSLSKVLFVSCLLVICVLTATSSPAGKSREEGSQISTKTARKLAQYIYDSVDFRKFSPHDLSDLAELDDMQSEWDEKSSSLKETNSSEEREREEILRNIMYFLEKQPIEFDDNLKQLAGTVLFVVNDFSHLINHQIPDCIDPQHQTAISMVVEHFFNGNIANTKRAKGHLPQLMAAAVEKVVQICMKKLNANIGNSRHVAFQSLDGRKVDSTDISSYAAIIDAISPGSKLDNKKLAKIGVLGENFNDLQINSSGDHGTKFARGLKELETDCKIMITGYKPYIGIYDSFNKFYEQKSVEVKSNLEAHRNYFRLCEEILRNFSYQQQQTASTANVAI